MADNGPSGHRSVAEMAHFYVSAQLYMRAVQAGTKLWPPSSSVSCREPRCRLTARQRRCLAATAPLQEYSQVNSAACSLRADPSRPVAHRPYPAIVQARLRIDDVEWLFARASGSMLREHSRLDRSLRRCLPEDAHPLACYTLMSTVIT